MRRAEGPSTAGACVAPLFPAVDDDVAAAHATAGVTPNVRAKYRDIQKILRFS
jgi:hypothetical protein